MSRCIALLALAAWSIAPTLAEAQAARRAYIQRTTSTEATLAWRDSSAGVDGACVGTAPSALTRHVGSTGTALDHAVVVDGLAPLSRWFYSVGHASCPPAAAGDPADHFTTAPAPGERAPFRVWVVGDSGTGAARQLAVRDAALAATADRPFDVFVHVGDMAYDTGTTSEFDRNFFAPYADVMRSTPTFPAIGNHEGASSDSASQTGPYYEAYVVPTDGRAGGLPSGTEAYYAYDWGDVHFVVLDSHESPRSPTGAMLRWLESDLASTSATWIIAYWHHPPYTKGSHDSDTEGQLVDMRENALPILEAHGVDLVLTGHSHIYERSFLLHGGYETPSTTASIVDPGDGRIDGDGPYSSGPLGALYIVAGHGGAGVSGSADHPVMFFSEVAHGSTILDIDGDTLQVRNVRYDGVETDHCTLVKADGLFVTSPRAGSVHRPGASIDVEWFRVGAPLARVNLDVTYDAGMSWAPIATGIPSTGSFAWTAPPTSHDAVQIRVSDADAPATSATSGVFSIASRVDGVVIPMGATWQYSDGRAAPPSGWATGEGGPWPEGPAELGYGDGDEATVLMNLDPNVATVYFRQPLDLGTGTVTAASLRGVYDDAIAVFVNGTQVHGVHVDDGLGHDVFSSGSDGDDAALPRTPIAIDAFVPGVNWIAALVKQDSAGSSDVSFDLELTLGVEYPSPDAGPGGLDAAIPPGVDGGPLPDGAVTPGVDVGTADIDAGEAPPIMGGCGCRVTATRASSVWAVLLALLPGALALGLRRRRSSRPDEVAG